MSYGPPICIGSGYMDLLLLHSCRNLSEDKPLAVGAEYPLPDSAIL